MSRTANSIAVTLANGESFAAMRVECYLGWVRAKRLSREW
jgi:hypothetical protein